QVLPYDVGAHPGMYGKFAILEFQEAMDASSFRDLVWRFQAERKADLYICDRRRPIMKRTGNVRFIRCC
ncbi:hypothetical protein ACWDNT_34270, partial [Streptomyces sp. NPDC000963]